MTQLSYPEKVSFIFAVRKYSSKKSVCSMLVNATNPSRSRYVDPSHYMPPLKKIFVSRE